MAWMDYSAAPPPGTWLCPALEAEGAIAVQVTTERGEFPVLVVRRKGVTRAFVNACPHQYLPLDYRGPQILSADGTQLMCTAHGASFCAETGEPLAGADCALDGIPIEEVAGEIRVAETAR